MYFEELDLGQVFNMRTYSRYLFLEFIEQFSLVLVGNQGSYDWHLFRLNNVVDREGQSKYRLHREYVYKGNTHSRIVGISVERGVHRARVWVLTEDRRLNVVEISRITRKGSNVRHIHQLIL